jgi:3-methylcrotonyl-CoA carboxylase alpha subunit
MHSPWTSLVSRRFGGDVYERSITLQEENAAPDSTPATIQVKSAGPGQFDVTVHAPSGEKSHFNSVSAQLVSPTMLSSTLNDEYAARVTVVSQRPPAAVPATSAPNTMERIHVFRGGAKTTLVVPSPKWLLALSEDLLSAAKGALRAPMPSLVVEVRVKLGDRVEKGQAVVVLESMKTETVLRSDVSGVVKAVGCKNGEMVEEGRDLVEIEEDVDAA